jgi:hypothetical protein
LDYHPIYTSNPRSSSSEQEAPALRWIGLAQSPQSLASFHVKGPRDVDGEFELELIRSLEHLIDTVGMVSLLVVQVLVILILVDDLEAFPKLLKDCSSEIVFEQLSDIVAGVWELWLFFADSALLEFDLLANVIEELGHLSSLFVR